MEIPIDTNEYEVHTKIAKEVLQQMKMTFVNMHVTRAISILGKDALSGKTKEAIRFNSIERVEKIYSDLLDNDGVSNVTTIMTKVGIRLCEDFLEVAK